MTSLGAALVLELHGVCKRFGSLVANDDVNLDLRPGEIHAIIGPNGAGKSTLIQQVSGALRPDAGRVDFLGDNVTDLSVPARSKLGLARTFQISQLAMEDTVLQNTLLGALVASGKPRSLWRDIYRDIELRSCAESALDRVGLLDHQTQPCASLSHGQRRQLEVAVALTRKPKAFLMDEPMAGLGSEGSAQMTRFLDGLRVEAPILLVEHDMDAVFALADRISVLVSGRIIASGAPDEIRADQKVQSAYLGETQ
ncbi:MAG: ABC transporter ATP-binding protein [Pseudomonadota bacterium]